MSSLPEMGRRCVLLAYVLLFGLILPFVCWGTHADPQHPHRHAHFVFQTLQPTPQATMQAHILVNSYSNDYANDAGDGVYEMPQARHAASPTDTGSTDARSNSAGMSSPSVAHSVSFSTSVITTLMQIVAAAFLFRVCLVYLCFRLQAERDRESFIGNIPTPPPQHPPFHFQQS